MLFILKRQYRFGECLRFVRNTYDGPAFVLHTLQSHAGSNHGLALRHRFDDIARGVRHGADDLTHRAADLGDYAHERAGRFGADARDRADQWYRRARKKSRRPMRRYTKQARRYAEDAGDFARDHAKEGGALLAVATIAAAIGAAALESRRRAGNSGR